MIPSADAILSVEVVGNKLELKTGRSGFRRTLRMMAETKTMSTTQFAKSYRNDKAPGVFVTDLRISQFTSQQEE